MADDIAQWFDGLSLGQYARAFAENEGDAKVSFELTDADLKDQSSCLRLTSSYSLCRYITLAHPFTLQV